MLTNCLKGLAIIAMIAASPIFLIFAVPFGCGMAEDLLDSAGTPAAIAFTTAACLAALSWVRYRAREFRPATAPPRTVARSFR